MTRILKALFGERAALFYLALFAIAVGAATFVENDFGTSSAQYWIYQARWFELLLLLFAGTLVYNMVKRRMVQRKQYAVVLFHLSIVIILLGSAVTRWSGYEGMVHLREGGSSNTLLTRELFLSVEASEGSTRYRGDQAIWPSSLGSFRWQHTFKSPLGSVDAKVLEATNRTIKNVIQGFASAVFFPI